MKDKRFIAGGVISGIWIAIAIVLVCTQAHPTELNAWGDFIAGFSAPLAFLWLVLGYLQQGDELRHSTQALRLQAEELKNSVEQQSQLVDISRRQLAQEMATLEAERESQRQKARPVFIATSGGYSSDHEIRGQIKCVAVLTNVGNKASSVRVFIENDGSRSGGMEKLLLNHGEFMKVTFSAPPESKRRLAIYYMDADNTPGQVAIDVDIANGPQHYGDTHLLS
ncbi:hypothetical protein D9M72_463870 [compost metagenome]